MYINSTNKYTRFANESIYLQNNIFSHLFMFSPAPLCSIRPNFQDLTAFVKCRSFYRAESHFCSIGLDGALYFESQRLPQRLYYQYANIFVQTCLQNVLRFTPTEISPVVCYKSVFVYTITLVTAISFYAYVFTAP